MEIERRTIVADELRVERREGKSPRIVGHAAVFNSLSGNLGGWFEQILPGTFKEAIEKDDVRGLFNHDPNYILGRNRSGSMTLREDARGLAFEIDVLDTQTLRDLVLAPIERGDVTGCSFAFEVRPGGSQWAEDDEGRTIRTLSNVRLYDVGPVVFPAYAATDVALREMRAFQAAKAPNPSYRNRLHVMDLIARI